MLTNIETPVELKIKDMLTGTKRHCRVVKWIAKIANCDCEKNNLRNKQKLRFAIFATIAICEIVVFVISQITQFALKGDRNFVNQTIGF